MRNKRKVRSGVVVSDKMDKTIVVRIDDLAAHKKYKKIYTKSSKLHVHDEKGDAGIGDEVTIAETRPLSKTKNWRLVSVNKKNIESVILSENADEEEKLKQEETKQGENN